MRTRPTRPGPLKRSLLVAGSIAVAVLGGSVPAGAHVSVHPERAPRGSFSILSFSVPNERPDASTVSVEVILPTDRPITYVSVQPVPGWTTTIERTTLDTPVTAHGRTVSDVVSRVVWSGGVIRPGEFQQFTVSAGPLPARGRTVAFKALQTYSSGEVVRWVEIPQRGAPEPRFPAPVLTLTTPKA